MGCHTRLGLFACLTLLALPAFGQGSENDGRSGTWTHNDSTLAVYEKGNRRVFKYDVPRKGMAEEGVRHGTLLFDGVVNGDQIFGTSRLFSGRCGKTVPYKVSGMISADGRSITMSGKAPRLDEQCQVAAFTDMTLAFDFVRPPPTPIVVSPRPQPDSSGPLRQENLRLREALATAQENARDAQISAASAASRASVAESSVVKLQEELKMQQGRSTVTEAPIYRETPGVMVRSLVPSVMVALISFMLQLAKNKLKIGVPAGKEIAIESLAAITSSVIMWMLGASNEITLLAIPIAGGLFSMALMMSVKHMVNDHHFHHDFAHAH